MKHHVLHNQQAQPHRNMITIQSTFVASSKQQASSNQAASRSPKSDSKIFTFHALITIDMTHKKDCAVVAS